MGVHLLFYILIASNLINVLHLGFYMVGANIYDILSFKNKKSPAVRAQAARPLVSVVVPAHNEAIVIERTLNSIRASSYKHIEIVVVDDGSTDKTPQIVRDYIKRLPLLRTQSVITPFSRGAHLHRYYTRMENRIRVVRITQSNKGKAAAMNNAIKNHVHGSLVMCLDADSVLKPSAIERAVRRFEDPKVIGVAANVQVMASRSLLGIVQRFEHMIGYRSKKFYTLTNSEFIVGGVGSTYRASAIRKVEFYDTDTTTEDIGLSLKLISREGNRNNRIVYAADVVALTEGVHSFKALLRQRYRWKMGCLQNLLKYRQLVGNTDTRKYGRMLTFYRLPMAFFGELMLLLEPLILGYVIYLSIADHSLAILFGAYITITAYALLTLWPDEHLSNREKLEMSSQALVIYLLLYVMDLVQIAAIIHCLIDYQKIIKRDDSGVWISPARAQQAI